jgi:uncharacterized protein YhdP
MSSGKSTLDLVKGVMTDGEWHTPGQMKQSVAGLAAVSESTITARIRDLRKPDFGGFNIESHSQGSGNGGYAYRMANPPKQTPVQMIDQGPIELTPEGGGFKPLA